MDHSKAQQHQHSAIEHTPRVPAPRCCSIDLDRKSAQNIERRDALFWGGPGKCSRSRIHGELLYHACARRTVCGCACSVCYLIPLDRTSQLEFVQRSQFLPTNILPAFLSPLKVHLSQLDATLANSPPPG